MDSEFPRKKRIIENEVVSTAPDVVLQAADVDIITDIDIIEICTMNYDLPPYKPLSHPGQIDICNNRNFNVVISPVHSKINSNVKRPLNEYLPSKTYSVPGDGDCLFSSIAYWITSCSDNCHEIRKLSLRV